MKQEMILGSIGTSLGVVGTATQVNEVLRTISLIVTIIGALITYIVVPLIAWYRKAKQDGKITADEIKEGVDIIADGSQKTKEEVDKLNDKEWYLLQSTWHTNI